MRYSIIILLFVLSGCYSSRKAAQQMERAKSEYEIVASDKCNTWYPIKTDSVFVTDTVLIPVNNIDYTNIIDSLYKIAMRQIKPLAANDTCASKVQPYIDQIKDLQGLVIGLKSSYKPCDTAYIFVNNKATVTKVSTAALRTLELKLEKSEASKSAWKTWCIILIILSVISLGFNYILIKRK